MDFYSFLYAKKVGETAVMDETAADAVGGKRFDEQKVRREAEGSSKGGEKTGGRFATKPETIEKQDTLNVGGGDAGAEKGIEELSRKIKTEFGSEVVRYDDMGRVLAGDTTAGFKEGWKYADKPDAKEELETLSDVYEVLRDLDVDFGFKPAIDVISIVKFRPVNDNQIPLGLSEDDHKYTDVSKMVVATNLFSCDGESYGHEDKRENRKDKIRHEIGHSCVRQDLDYDFGCVLKEISNKFPGRLKTKLRDFSSKYAVSTGYATEIMAEMFARFTAKDYPSGFFPQIVEDFITFAMMGEEP